MAFPVGASVGQQFVTATGETYELNSSNAWDLVRDTRFSINHFVENTAVDAGADFLVWYDASASAHRKIRISSLASLFGTTPVVTNPGGVGLV